jgi:hypothetical protein
MGHRFSLTGFSGHLFRCMLGYLDRQNVGENLGNYRESNIHFTSTMVDVLYLRIGSHGHISDAGDRNCGACAFHQTPSSHTN